LIYDLQQITKCSKKKFSGEIIRFCRDLNLDVSFESSIFNNLDLINIEFINVNFESSYFKKYLVEK